MLVQYIVQKRCQLTLLLGDWCYLPIFSTNYLLVVGIFLQNNTILWPKCHNSTIYRNIYQSTIVLEICRDLPLFGYSSSMNSNSIKKFLAIFSKNSSLWNPSYIANSNFTNSSFKKVVDLYIFPKQWQIDIYFGKQWYLSILTSFRQLAMLAKMAKYHCLLKYILIYHCFRNMQGSTIFLKLEFVA